MPEQGWAPAGQCRGAARWSLNGLPRARLQLPFVGGTLVPTLLPMLLPRPPNHGCLGSPSLTFRQAKAISLPLSPFPMPQSLWISLLLLIPWPSEVINTQTGICWQLRRSLRQRSSSGHQLSQRVLRSFELLNHNICLDSDSIKCFYPPQYVLWSMASSRNTTGPSHWPPRTFVPAAAGLGQRWLLLKACWNTFSLDSTASKPPASACLGWPPHHHSSADLRLC